MRILTQTIKSGVTRMSNFMCLSKPATSLHSRWGLMFFLLLAGGADLKALQLSETHFPDPVVVGGKLTFTFTLSNDGATPASGTLFTNLLPPSTVFVSANATNGNFAVSNNTVFYTPDSLPPGGEVVFEMVLTPVTPLLITNVAFWAGIGGELSVAFSLVTVGSVLPGPMMNVGHIGHKSTLLLDGRVLITGGRSIDGDFVIATAKAESFDPTYDSFTLTGNMRARREFHSATLLDNGMVLVAGGSFIGTRTTTNDLFNPTSNVFVATANMAVPRASHTATLLQNGDVILAGGASTNTLIERFHFTNGIGSISPAGNLAVPRSGHLATLLPDGKILFAGGTTSAYPYVEIYNPETGISVSVSTNGYELPPVAFVGGKILMFGMIVAPHLLANIYDVQSNNFVSITPPSDAHQAGNFLALNTGEVLITGGFFTAGVDIFNPNTGTFAALSPLTSSRTEHSAIQLKDGRIFLTGGNDLIGTLSGDNKSTEFYVIRLDFDQDGMDDEWEIVNGFDPSSRADAIQDADGDGHTNLQEYLAGTNPHDLNSIMKIVTAQKDANTLRIRFNSVLGKLYSLERTTNNFSGNWSTVAMNIPGTGAVVEIADPVLPGAGQQLYRVRLLP